MVLDCQRASSAAGHDEEFFTKYFWPYVEQLPAMQRGSGKLKTFDELKGDMEIIRLKCGQTVNDPATLRSLRASSPDIVVGTQIGQKLGAPLCKIPRLGAWYAHWACSVPDLLRRQPDGLGLALYKPRSSSSSHTGVLTHTQCLNMEWTPLQNRLALAEAVSDQICRLVSTVPGQTSQDLLAPKEETNDLAYLSYPTSKELESWHTDCDESRIVMGLDLVPLMKLFSDGVLPEWFIQSFQESINQRTCPTSL